MTTLQAVLRDWSLFAGAGALLAAAALAVALLIARRGARRLSSRSRYMLVAIALIVPVVAAFLIPIAAGAWDRLLAWRDATSPSAPGVIATDIDVTGIAAAAPVIDALSLLALLWGAGFVLIAAARLGEWVRWTRVGRRAALCDDGRVIGAFNRAWGGHAAPPTVRMSPSCAEPMVVGLVDPVVLLPVGYGDGMTDTEIESVAVHELEHVMRRDNLDAATVDLIASIFWFDPFHWIARGRLLELREGACDERVLASGLPPRAYLSALAKTSHASITTPAVACMSGFRIRERMESIMSYPTHKSHWISEGAVRASALAVLGLLALAIAGFAPVVADDHDDSTRSAEVSMGQHIVKITTRPSPGGQILIEAEIRTPDGTLVSAPRIVAMAGEPVDVSTTVGGKKYKLSITAAADGSGFARLDVLEGDEIVDTVVKSLEAPSERLRRPAEKISLSLRDADVRDFAGTLSQLTGVNVHVASAAAGRISIDVKDVPWDQAVGEAVAPLGLVLVLRNGDAYIVPRAAVPESALRSPFASGVEGGVEGGVVGGVEGGVAQGVEGGVAGAVQGGVRSTPPGYERAGGDIKAPTVLTRVDPMYPEEARKERVQGIVIVETLIGADGAVQDVTALKGLPFGLTEAAVDAVRQWTFAPGTKNGVPVPVAFTLTINFKLDGKEKKEP